MKLERAIYIVLGALLIEGIIWIIILAMSALASFIIWSLKPFYLLQNWSFVIFRFLFIASLVLAIIMDRDDDGMSS